MIKTTAIRARIFVDGAEATSEFVAACWFDPPAANKDGNWGGQFRLNEPPKRGIMVSQCELRLTDGTTGTIVVSKLVNGRDGVFIGSGDPPAIVANAK